MPESEENLNKDTLSDILSPEEYQRAWHEVQFGKRSSITWIEIVKEDSDASDVP